MRIMSKDCRGCVAETDVDNRTSAGVTSCGGNGEPQNESSHALRYSAFMAGKIERGQLSLRPSLRTLRLLRDRARRSGDKHTVLAERYLEEGVLMDEHPGIHFVDGALGRRPAVMGTGLDVSEIVEVARDNGGAVAETAAYLEIDPRYVKAALVYYGSNRGEIDDWLARSAELSEREESRWRAARDAIGA